MFQCNVLSFMNKCFQKRLRINNLCELWKVCVMPRSFHDIHAAPSIALIINTINHCGVPRWTKQNMPEAQHS